MTYPGKKLWFMGNEFGAGARVERARRARRGRSSVSRPTPACSGCIAISTGCTGTFRALHELDFEQGGFEWIDCHDAARSVLAFVRRARDGSFVIVALNFTPVPRSDYHVGVPRACAYRELVNTDSRHYGGGDLGNRGEIVAKPGHPSRPATLALVLPPLAALVLVPA